MENTRVSMEDDGSSDPQSLNSKPSIEFPYERTSYVLVVAGLINICTHQIIGDWIMAFIGHFWIHNMLLLNILLIHKAPVPL